MLIVEGLLPKAGCQGGKAMLCSIWSNPPEPRIEDMESGIRFVGGDDQA